MKDGLIKTELDEKDLNGITDEFVCNIESNSPKFIKASKQTEELIYKYWGEKFYKK